MRPAERAARRASDVYQRIGAATFSGDGVETKRSRLVSRNAELLQALDEF